MLREHETYTMRGGGATKKLFVALFVVLLAALTLTPPAFGAVKDGRTIEVDYGIDFVVLDGFPANTNVRVDVLRGPNDVVVGSTTQRTSGLGLLEINHIGGGQFPGGDCWGPSQLNPNAPNVTPDILPGDEIQSTVLDENGTPVDPADVDFTAARDIFIDTGATTVDRTNDTITMKGHVRSTPNAPINTAAEPLELRLNAIGFTWQTNNNRRDLRDNVSAADFTADGDGDPNTFVHVFSVSDTDANNAFSPSGINAEQIFEWAGGITDPPPEITVFSGEGGVLGGCPPHARTAVTDVSTHTVAGKPVVNSNNVGNAMVVGGVANGAETVSVSIPGGQPNEGVLTPAFDPAAPNVNQTWTATIPASELASLPQGQFNITANFTGASVPATSTLSALKDTVNPAAPTASPPAGRYSSAQAVTLNESEADPAARIHYTIGATPPDPDANDREFTGQIQVTATQTIKAVVVDGAGNVSPVETFAYTIGPVTITAPGAPTIGNNPTAGNASATVNWTPPANNGGRAITEYRVRVYNSAGTLLRNVTGIPGSATSQQVTNLTNGTAYKFKVQASNTPDGQTNVWGAESAFSNTVTPGTQPPPVGGLPGAPTIGTAVNGVAGGTVSATARWSAPANNGGSAITGYLVTAVRVNASGAPHSTGQTATMTAGANATSKEMTTANINSGTLVSGAFYKFKVQASNTPTGAKQYGTASALSNQVTAR